MDELAPGEPGPAGGTAPGARLLDLVEVLDRLRTDCPWDAKQTHASLAPFLLEETYEALEALDGGDAAAIREELGDVLLQVVFHARVAAERADGTGYTIDDVADGIIAKLIRRHPHVFGDVTVSGAQEVTANWDAIKAAELADLTGPGADPELGGQPPPAGPPPAAGPGTGVSEIGAELFALAARARAAGLDPELELRSAARAYRDRVQAWERAARAEPGSSP